MEIFQSIMYVALPIVGILIGATLQYLFSRFSEKQKHQQDLRTQAYIDFLCSIAGVAIAKKQRYR